MLLPSKLGDGRFRGGAAVAKAQEESNREKMRALDFFILDICGGLDNGITFRDVHILSGAACRDTIASRLDAQLTYM